MQAQLEEEKRRYSQMKDEHDNHERTVRELQAELKKSKQKSMKEQDIYNKILHVSMLKGYHSLAVLVWLNFGDESLL